uniref:Uncharacterized protein n=1 Tax=Tetraselmis sp. GSL018 TaxID=582737 RepID=A0A061QLQ3_9CHLO
MGKKKGSSLQHKSSRRNRLVIFNGELDASEEDTENDPVAAAIRAKYERRGALGQPPPREPVSNN